MSVNMSRVETLNAGQLAMAARNPGRAKWQGIQHQVTPHIFFTKKFLNVVDEAVRRVQAGAGTKCNVRLAVEAVNASSATKRSTKAPIQCFDAFKRDARSAATTDDQLNEKSQALSSVRDLFNKVPGFLKELPLDGADLTRLVLILFISIQLLEHEYFPDEAIPEMIFIIVFVFVNARQKEGINCLNPSLLQMATDKKFLYPVCSLALLSLSGRGVYAADSTESIIQSCEAVEEHDDSFRLTAAFETVAIIVIGSVAVWKMFQRRRRAIPAIGGIDRVLQDLPMPTKSNPNCVISLALRQ